MVQYRLFIGQIGVTVAITHARALRTAARHIVVSGSIFVLIGLLLLVVAVFHKKEEEKIKWLHVAHAR